MILLQNTQKVFSLFACIEERKGLKRLVKLEKLEKFDDKICDVQKLVLCLQG